MVIDIEIEIGINRFPGSLIEIEIGNSQRDAIEKIEIEIQLRNRN
jgi:hypothetical protein